MRILIIGGGVFVGRAISRQLLERGHQVTCLVRGRSQPGPVAGVEVVVGDRRDPAVLKTLSHTDWDALVDTCAYRPADLEQPLQWLGECVECWQFISTISVQQPPYPPHPDEDAPLWPPVDPEAPLAENYGALKAMCEDLLLEELEERALIVRPGLIVGPEDVSERFTWWVRQLAAGVAPTWPGQFDQPCQWVDVRDLAAFCVHLLEEGAEGVVQVAGPADPPSLPEALERMARVLCPELKPEVLAPERWLQAGVRPWEDLPLWMPEEEFESFRIDIRRALGAGLELRSLEQTVRDTWAWAQANAPRRALPGLAELRARLG